MFVYPQMAVKQETKYTTKSGDSQHESVNSRLFLRDAVSALKQDSEGCAFAGL